MKKLLGFIIFSFLFFSNASAETCGFTWSIRDNPGITPPYFVRFDFKNDTNDVAKISGVTLYTQSNKIVHDRIFKKRGSGGKILDPEYIKPNSEWWIAFGHGADWPWDIIKKASIKCVVFTYDQYEDELLGKIKNKQKSSNTETSSSNNSDKYDWVAYIVFIVIGFIIFAGVLSIFEDGKKDKPSQERKIKRKETSDFDKGYKEGSNFIETVWNGQVTMAKTFWIYCILFVAITSFVAGILSTSQGSFIFIIPAVVIIWSNTGLWRSSNIYQNQKLKSGQTYGWATAAKVYVVLNYITTLSQLGFILRGF